MLTHLNGLVFYLVDLYIHRVKVLFKTRVIFLTKYLVEKSTEILYNMYKQFTE